MSWKHAGYTIEVRNDGSFGADVDGTTVSGDSLTDCRAKIDVEVKTAKKTLRLPVIGILAYEEYRSKARNDRGGEIIHALLTGINRTTRDPICEGIPTNYRIKCILPDMPEAMKFLTRYAAMRKEEALMRSILPQCQVATTGYGRINAGKDYNDLLEALDERYNKVKNFTLDQMLKVKTTVELD